jgi:hypothetical protein
LTFWGRILAAVDQEVEVRMDSAFTISRRGFLAGAALVALHPEPLLAQAARQPLVIVHRDPLCGCCGGWTEHVEAAGFPVRTVETSDLEAVKTWLGVPAEVGSCHTAEVDGYVIEGHVPAAALRRLLAERPSATGLAVPGMPIGSPGMEIPGAAPDRYDVLLFGPTGQTVFATFLGAQEL